MYNTIFCYRKANSQNDSWCKQRKHRHYNAIIYLKYLCTFLSATGSASLDSLSLLSLRPIGNGKLFPKLCPLQFGGLWHGISQQGEQEVREITEYLCLRSSPEPVLIRSIAKTSKIHCLICIWMDDLHPEVTGYKWFMAKPLKKGWFTLGKCCLEK